MDDYHRMIVSSYDDFHFYDMIIDHIIRLLISTKEDQNVKLEVLFMKTTTLKSVS